MCARDRCCAFLLSSRFRSLALFLFCSKDCVVVPPVARAPRTENREREKKKKKKKKKIAQKQKEGGRKGGGENCVREEGSIVGEQPTTERKEFVCRRTPPPPPRGERIKMRSNRRTNDVEWPLERRLRKPKTSPTRKSPCFTARIAKRTFQTS